MFAVDPQTSENQLNVNTRKMTSELYVEDFDTCKQRKKRYCNKHIFFVMFHLT